MRRPKRESAAQEKRSFWEVLLILGFPGVFIVAGFVLLWAGSAEWRHARASASWPTTSGIVEKSFSTIDRHQGRHIEIVYSYEVQASPFQSRRVAFGSYNPATGLRWLRDYPVGASVTVHYDPRNPSNSVLEPALVAGSWVMPSFGVLFLAVGCLFGRFVWRSL